MTTPPTPRSDADEFGSASALRAPVEHRPLSADDLSVTEYMLAGALCHSGVHHPQLPIGSTVCGVCAELATFAVVALADQLLPEDAKREVEYGLGRSDRSEVSPYRTREQAELWQGYSEPGWQVMCREAVTTPWRPATAEGGGEADPSNALDREVI